MAIHKFVVTLSVHGFKTREDARDYLENGWCDGVFAKFAKEEKPKKPLTEGQKRGIAKRAANRKAKEDKFHKDFMDLSLAITNAASYKRGRVEVDPYLDGITKRGNK